MLSHLLDLRVISAWFDKLNFKFEYKEYYSLSRLEKLE